MFSLSALGVLFMYLMARKSVAHNVIMLASILPIAFTANIIRVMVLVLVTYYLGDEAGQGFLHGAAGMVLMGAALAVLVLLDSLLALVLKPKATPSA
jgi:exosortase/archaeosortase family protein